MKKPRSDSKILSLPPEAQKRIREWLVKENLSYEEVQERVSQEFSLRVSTGALSEFYSRHCWAERYEDNRALAEAFKPSAEKFDPVIIQAVKSKIFELSRSRDPNVDAITALFKVLGDSAKLEIKEQELALRERQVALAEKKASLADQAKDIVGSESLTAEEKAANLRALFGMGG